MPPSPAAVPDDVVPADHDDDDGGDEGGAADQAALEPGAAGALAFCYLILGGLRRRGEDLFSFPFFF